MAWVKRFLKAQRNTFGIAIVVNLSSLVFVIGIEMIAMALSQSERNLTE